MGRGVPAEDAAAARSPARPWTTSAPAASRSGEPENAHADVDETRCTTVSDNRFVGAGQVYLGSPAVWIGQSSHNLVAHNEISGPLMWAISVGWTWSYFPLQRARDNVIEFNHCHDIGTGAARRRTAPHALGTSPGTVIRNNYVHHVQCSSFWQGAGEGIILDNGCSGILVENNVVHDAVAGGFGTNFNCFGNIVLNNIFAYGRGYQLTVYGDPAHRSATAERRGLRPQHRHLDRRPAHQGARLAVVHHPLGSEPLLARPGKAGVVHEVHLRPVEGKGARCSFGGCRPTVSQCAGRDFRLRPGSPAAAIGFRPIDLSTVGPRP